MPDRRRGLLVALALVTALVLGACGGTDAPSGTLTASRVAPPFELADVALESTEGGTMSLADPDARLTLVFFGYTHCPDVCPLVMSTIATALTRLEPEDRDQVQLVFVTTDPPRDDAETIRRYLDGYDPTAVGLTGDLEDVEALGDSVGIFVADAEELASGGYDLGSHGSQVIAVDGEGRAPAFWRQDVSSADLAADIDLLLRS
ncbi:SCO family protein [uncultured Nocardioides sp.]|uniref:SCO family protein n=1 Tax=uncultured Nocardioides sp. TaxID=198441 RepID=UPI00261314B9|nr:SCO family protein [uncultured Nocardioides sp.]